MASNMGDVGSQRSYWWTSLLEFGEDVLVSRRKQRGLTQQNIAVKCGLNQSEISRFEKGLAKPRDVPTLETLCTVYDLGPAERQRYIELTTGFTPTSKQEGIEPILNLIKNQIAFISHTNRAGNPKVAINQAELLISWLDGYFDRRVLQSPQWREQLALILLEESAAWWDISEPQKISSFTVPLLSRMEKLTENSIQPDDPGNCYLEINKGFHEYVKGNYREAESSFDWTMQHADCVNESWQVEVLRASTVVKGKLQHIDGLEKNHHIIAGQIQSSTMSNLNKAYLLEGLGRAYIDMKPELGLNYLRDSNSILMSAMKEPQFLEIRFIQHRRSFVAALKRNNAPSKTIVDVASPALRAAKKCGFNRHYKQIKEAIHL